MTPLVKRIRAGEALEVAPAAHFSMGGVRIATSGETGVPGLFAAGEVAGGLHGANRLSGNAGAQILVQGKAAGISAAHHATANQAWADAINLDEANAATQVPITSGDSSVLASALRVQFDDISNEALGPIREHGKLESALSQLRSLAHSAVPNLTRRHEQACWNRDWAEALEVRMAQPILEATVLAAQKRLVSIGAHHRCDALERPEQRYAHGLIHRDGDGLAHRFQPVSFEHARPS